uniref:Fibronectin type-III domain-containing protein n=1 Tax=Trichuris muris TaxID=70415 RepID=A0A5S6QML1_TRIMR
MSTFIFSIFMLITIANAQSQTFGLTVEQLNMMDKVVTCRAHCIDAFGYRSGSTTDAACHLDADCFMCWENCEMFYRTFEIWGPMCDEPSICFDGCRLACAVYRLNLPANGAHTNLWAFTQQIKVLKSLNMDQIELRWSPPIPLLPIAPPIPRLVYALFWKVNTQSDQWLPLNHTVSTTFYSTNLDVVRNSMDFMVFAYTKDGRAAVTQLKEYSARIELPEQQGNVAKLKNAGPLLDSDQSGAAYFKLPLVGYLSLIVIACVLIFVVAIIVCKHVCLRSHRLWSINSNRAIRFRRVAAVNALEKRLSLTSRAQTRNDGLFASSTNLLNVKKRSDQTPDMERSLRNYENCIEENLSSAAPVSLYCDSPELRVHSEGNCLLRIMDYPKRYGRVLVDPDELRKCLHQELPTLV